MKETALVLWHYIYARYGLRFKTRVALEYYQQKRLQYFLKTVLSKSPYYKLYQGKPLASYPLMNKTKMMANFDELNTRHLKLNQAMNVALKAEQTRDFSETIGDITVGLSSGTSGTRGIFAVSRKEQLKWAGTILAKILPDSLLQKHKIVFFLRADNKLYQAAEQHGRVSIHFFDLTLPFEEHLSALQYMNPTQIVAPATTLRLLAEAKQENKIEINPKRITSVAEVLDPLDKAIIESSFKQPVDQIYQCTEGFLAYTCKQKRIHINEEFLYIEKEWVDKETKRFIPIITDFSRTTQPIVRYRLDDILVLDEHPCKCGSPTTVISRIEGRMDDVLYGKKNNGEFVPLFPDHLRHLVINTTET
ncbi:MAG: F390 synthetase-related protein, partial [Pseudomonadota bacterium]